MATSDSALMGTIGKSDLGSKLYQPSQVLLDKSLRYLSSVQTSGTFSQGHASWLIKNISTAMFSWAEAGIEFMAAVTSSGTAYTSTSQIALKNSILSMITGHRVYVNGTQVLSEQDIQALNNLRLLTGYSKNFSDTKAAQLGFYKDDQNQLTPQAIVDSATFTAGTADSTLATVKVASPPYSEVIDANAANKGYMKRLQYMKVRQYAVVSGTIYYRCYVPLRYISKFFEYWVQPVRDSEIELYIDFDYTNTSGKIFPLQHSSGVSDTTISIVADYLGGANFVYKPVVLNSGGLEKYSSLLQTGMITRFDFESILACQKAISNSTDTSFEFQVSASCPRYLRLWMMIVPTGAWSSQSNTNPLHCLELPTSFQYYIQQDRQLDREYTSPREFYESAVAAGRQMTPYENETTINMSEEEFTNLYKFVCIDLYHVKNEGNRTSSGKDLQVSFTRASATACDVYTIIEERKSTTIQQSNGLFTMQISKSL